MTRVRTASLAGEMKASLGVTGCPAVELMTLAKTGIRALLGAVSGPPATGRRITPASWLHLLDETMLVPMDRGFDAAAFLAEVACTAREPPDRFSDRPVACGNPS